MKYNPISRRHFLQGLGGMSLSLPFLNSLMPKAMAQAGGSPKYLVSIVTPHGGYSNENILGPVLSDLSSPVFSRELFRSAGSSSQGDWPDHYVNLAQLSEAKSSFIDPNDPDSGRPRLSFCVGEELSTYLDRMFMMTGAGVYYSHGHTRQMLGNLKSVQLGIARDLISRPNVSLDYLLSRDQHSFYSEGLPAVPLINVSRAQANTSVTFDFGGQPVGPTALGGLVNPHAIYGFLFPPVDQADIPLVNRVWEDWQRLRSSRKISRDDRNRVDQFLGELDSIERGLMSGAGCIVPPGLQSDLPPNPEVLLEDFENADQYWEQVSSIITLAFLCGKSRIATLVPHPTQLYFDSWQGAAYHPDVAHQHLSDPYKQTIHALSLRSALNKVFLKFVKKLDEFNILDDALVFLSSECGERTHRGYTLPVIAAGSAGGFFKTNNYVDTRNHDNLCFLGSDQEETRPGILWLHWLSTILDSMGMPKAAYAQTDRLGHSGYPSQHVYRDSDVRSAVNNMTALGPYISTAMNSPIPWLLNR